MTILHLLKNISVIKKAMQNFVDSTQTNPERSPRNGNIFIFVAMNKNNHPVAWHPIYSRLEIMATEEGHTIVKVPMLNMGVIVELVEPIGDTQFLHDPKTRNEIKIDIRKKKQRQREANNDNL